MPTHDFKNIGEVLDFELLKGTIATLDSAADTCTVTVGGDIVTALLYYHCTPASELRDNGAISGAAKGFKVGDEVIVLINKEKTSIKVIGHTDGIRRCEEDKLGDYYIFYKDGTILKIAQCSWDTGIVVVDTKTAAEIFVLNPNNYPVKFLAKRFTHNVPVNGIPTARDLYFISTSLQLAGSVTGWDNFATANPTFSLVTNNGNTKITRTTQVLADLNAVNYAVNHEHAYVSHPSGLPNVWKILGTGEGGNCSDFALTKAQALLELGYPASALHIETGVINTTLSHAWLVVQTTGGDYALNNASDSIIINSALKSVLGTDFYCRHRQIGSNWAFMSSFAWLDSAVNTNQIYHYILDPLLNILHFWFTSPKIIGGVTVGGESPFYSGTGPSINFSADNNSIYLAAGIGITGYDITPGNIYKFKLNENKLDLISTRSNSIIGPVGRDGNIVSVWFMIDPVAFNGVRVNYDVVSKNGYYDFVDYPWYPVVPTGSQLIIPPATISKEISNPFYQRSPSGVGFVTPFRETISPVLRWPFLWNHIEKGDMAIQAFFFLENTNVNSVYGSYPRSYYDLPRMYKDGVSCLSEVIAAADATEANLLGLTYIPSTNRLN